MSKNRILIVSCSLNPDSNSRILARAAQELLNSQAEVTWLDLHETLLPLCDGSSAYGDANARKVKQLVAQAQAIILAVPIYNYDVNAAAKNLIELTGDAWEEKVVGFLCAAGGQGSYMSIMALANSLMLDFRCLIVPRFVYATGDAFEGPMVTHAKIKERLRQLSDAVLKLAKVRDSLVQDLEET